MAMAVPSFAFGNGFAAKTPQDVARNRAVYNALLTGGTKPVSLGTGLTAVGEAIVARLANERANEGEAAGQAHAAELLKTMQGSNPSVADLVSTVSDPWVAQNPGESAVAQTLLQRGMQKADPAYQTDLALKQEQLDALKQRDEGYHVLTADEAAAAGLPPDSTYQMGPDKKVEPIDPSKGVGGGYTLDENGNVIDGGNFSTLDIGRFNLASTRATKVFRDTQTFKSASNAGFYLAKLKAATDGSGSIKDQEILDSISQFNTGGGRVTEAQVNLILKGKSLSDTVNSWYNTLGNGGVLSDEQRKQALALAQATAGEFLTNYDKKYKPLAENLKKQRIPKEFWDIPTPEELRGEYAGDPADKADGTTATVPASGKDEPTAITDDAGYDALPSGAKFKGPDGKVRQKP